MKKWVHPAKEWKDQGSLNRLWPHQVAKQVALGGLYGVLKLSVPMLPVTLPISFILEMPDTKRSTSDPELALVIAHIT